MFGRLLLAHLEHRTFEMRKVKAEDPRSDFGGIPIRQFCGDVHQLGAVLMKAIHNMTAATKPISACAMGRRVFQTMISAGVDNPNVKTLALVIQAVQRQKDDVFKAILQAIREGRVTHEMVTILERRLWSALSQEEQELFWKEALFLMPTWKQTKPITIEYLKRLNKAPAVIEADITRVKSTKPLAEMRIPKQTVLMEGATVMLTRNWMVEDGFNLYNGAIGTVIGFGYPKANGPLEAKQPKYVLVEFPNTKLKECYDPQRPKVVPIPVSDCYCDYKCCTVSNIPLIVYKASTVHKAQGLSIGKGQMFKRVVVGVSGSRAQPGLDLVSFSRAQELGDLAIWNANGSVVTQMDLLALGTGEKYAPRRQFERLLQSIQAQTVPYFMEAIRSQDECWFNDEPTFAGGLNCLFVQYYKRVCPKQPFPEPNMTDTTHTLVDLKQLGEEANAFLKELPTFPASLVDPLAYKAYEVASFVQDSEDVEEETDMEDEPSDTAGNEFDEGTDDESLDMNNLLSGLNDAVFFAQSDSETESMDEDALQLDTRSTRFGFDCYVGREVESHRFYTYNGEIEDFRTPFEASNTGKFFLPAYASERRRRLEGLPNAEDLLCEVGWFKGREMLDVRELPISLVSVYRGCVYLLLDQRPQGATSGFQRLVMLPFEYMESYQSSALG